MGVVNRPYPDVGKDAASAEDLGNLTRPKLEALKIRMNLDPNFMQISKLGSVMQVESEKTSQFIRAIIRTFEKIEEANPNLSIEDLGPTIAQFCDEARMNTEFHGILKVDEKEKDKPREERLSTRLRDSASDEDRDLANKLLEEAKLRSKDASYKMPFIQIEVKEGAVVIHDFDGSTFDSFEKKAVDALEMDVVDRLTFGRGFLLMFSNAPHFQRNLETGVITYVIPVEGLDVIPEGLKDITI